MLTAAGAVNDQQSLRLRQTIRSTTTTFNSSASSADAARRLQQEQKAKAVARHEHEDVNERECEEEEAGSRFALPVASSVVTQTTSLFSVEACNHATLELGTSVKFVCSIHCCCLLKLDWNLYCWRVDSRDSRKKINKFQVNGHARARHGRSSRSYRTTTKNLYLVLTYLYYYQDVVVLVRTSTWTLIRTIRSIPRTAPTRTDSGQDTGTAARALIGSFASL